jgi:5-hydroxyisourate hydrolase-like protein (transthyretin family)
MTFLFLALALLQGAPAPTKPVVRGSIAGTVRNGATGDPLANVRVTLAKVNSSPEAIGFLREMTARDPSGAPQREVALPGVLLEMMSSELAMMQLEIERAAKDGKPRDVPPEMAFMASLPLDDLDSILVDPAGKLAVVSKSAPPTATDGAGRFAFQDLEPGTYRLLFEANGFVKQDYGQQGTGGGTPVLLEAGKSIEDLVARLTPTGTLTGRIVDTRGRPLAAVAVQLSRFAYDATGKKKIKPAMTARTDERGEYRFYYLTPGRYYISAGSLAGQDRTAEIHGLAEAAMLGVSGPPPGANRISDRRYTRAHYPGTTDVGTATAIEVGAGAQLNDIDFALTAQGAYTVRGRILDPNGGVPQQAIIRLVMADGTMNGPMNRGQNYNPADGSFELREVPTGSYLLVADLPNRNRRAEQELPPNILRNMSDEEQRAYYQAFEIAMMAEQSAQPRAFLPITVTNADIEGLVVGSTVGASFGGRLRVESPAPAARNSRTLSVDQLGILFSSVGADGSPIGRYNGLTPQTQGIKPDGTFRVVAAFPGQYWLRLLGLPSGYYVESAKLGDIDVLNRPLTLPVSDANLTLDIVIGANVGQIEGAATAAGRPVPGAQVVLIPDRNRDRAELFRPVNADAVGRFLIPDVEPGDYRLAAWPSLEPYAYFDPELIKQAEEKGTPVRVGESSNQSFTVEAISAP